MNFYYIGKIDKVLFSAVLLLVVVGLITIFSVSYSGGGADFVNFEKQVLFALIGFAGMFFVASLDYRMLKNYSGAFYVLMLLLLVAVLFLGSVIRGTTGWFDLGYFSLQPAEFAKVVMIIVLAKSLSELGNYSRITKKILVSGIYMAFPVGLILLQPDLGSSLVIVFIWFCLLCVFGLKKKQIIFFTLLGALTSVASWIFVLQDYQKNRILTFIDPQMDPLGRGYNVIQSMVAIGSGSFWGKGLGHGSQSQLNFLPEKHTDFIFAVIAEEMGFIGGALVLVLFAIIFYRLFVIAEEAQDNFGKLLVLGTVFLLIFHMLINIGMNMGIMPVTGIPLPFVSYGGSSLIAFMLVIGVVQSVYVNGRRYRFKGEGDEL
ncbi:MAG: rod shape-determining protein RodA [Candidatus Pacebacteria bacterium]|nr:rod shape-determining protein RodA [Candidatus Paceibacterota bacterium]